MNSAASKVRGWSTAVQPLKSDVGLRSNCTAVDLHLTLEALLNLLLKLIKVHYTRVLVLLKFSTTAVNYRTKLEVRRTQVLNLVQRCVYYSPVDGVSAH